jgi:uncharacterized NAD(P)/FAD-binding protein YdhS
LFLGLDVSADGAIIDKNGRVSKTLYTVGPSRKGAVWESTAVPELRLQIQKMAAHLVRMSGWPTRRHARTA